MKKYYIFVFALILILSSFSVSPANAEDLGCAPGNSFSTTTGQPCSGGATVICSTGYVYSSTTGQKCTTWQDDNNASDVAQFNALWKSSFKVGVRGEDVKALQKFLKDQDYYYGKIDGKYGRITARAVKDFQDDNDISNQPIVEDPCKIKPELSFCQNSNASPIISGVSGPQVLNVNQEGTWKVTAYNADGKNWNLSYTVVWGDESLKPYASADIGVALGSQTATFSHTYSQAGNYTPVFTVTNNSGKTAKTSLSVNVNSATTKPASITVLSPNGGESWAKGSTQTIRWQDNSLTTMQGCSLGSNCYTPNPTYDIKLIPLSFHTDIVCVGMTSCSGNYTDTSGSGIRIASGVSSLSYVWTIPSDIFGAGDLFSFAPSKIQVCKSGTDVCDSSDDYFNITNPTTTTQSTPTISYINTATGSAPKVGDVVNIFGTNFTSNTDISIDGSAEPYINLAQFSSPTVISFVVPSNLIVGSHSLTVYTPISGGGSLVSNTVYLNIISPVNTTPSITVLSPNSGERWVAGRTSTVSWSASNAPADAYVGRVALYKGANFLIDLIPFLSHFPSSGSVQYAVPLNSVLGNDFKIQTILYRGDSELTQDWSDVFSIVANDYYDYY